MDAGVRVQAVRMSDALPGPVWFVRAAGQVWGPYPEARLALFAQEGRIDDAAPVSPSPQGPFAPAARQPRLAALFAPPAPRLVEPAAPGLRLVEPQREPEAPRPSSPLSPAAEAAVAPGRPRPLLVFAALASLPASRFEAALGAYGEHRAVGPGLWLIRARLGPAPLRNALSRRLRGEDALLVVEASLDQAAWFNLAGDSERDLRRLWAGEGELGPSGPRA